MSPGVFTIRLAGGPYDGDQDHLDELPPYLWAFPCTCDPACDLINDVHWYWGNDRLGASQDGAEEYRHSHEDALGHVYTWAPLHRDGARRRHQAATR